MGDLFPLVLILVRPYVVIRERRHAITPAEQRAAWRYVLLSPATAVLALLLWVAERFMGSWSPAWRHAEAALLIAALAVALFSWFALSRLAR